MVLALTRIAAFILAVGITVAVLPAQTRTLYVDNRGACSDTSTAGTETTPFCTMNYASTRVVPGDTVLVSSVRDGSGPAEFTRSGTATALITYKSTVGTVIGSFVDVKDEDFQPTAVPGVFSLSGAPAGGVIWQTRWPSILVDDTNPSRYTMVDTDGPLQLGIATDDATLQAQPGTYRWVSGTLFVHPYGSRTPSVTETDLVVGTGRSLNTTTKTNYLVLDGFTVTYAGSPYSFMMYGIGHQLRNLTFIGVSPQLKGSRHTLENYKVTHVHRRDQRSNWTWTTTGIGGAVDVLGSSHVLRNGRIWHNWNSTINTEAATGTLIDGIRAHGAPNHSLGFYGNPTVRNAVAWNAQDYWWQVDPNGQVLEHIIAVYGINVEALNRTMGALTIRNSIINGPFTFIRGLSSRCYWGATVIENNVLSANATIERCEDMRAYPIAEYVSRCASGEWTNCATFRGNRFVSDWKTVLKDGMWNGSMGDSWDVTPVADGLAIDIGLANTPTDILGMPRPQGPSADAGVFEYFPLCVCPPQPVFVKRPGM